MIFRLLGIIIFCCLIFGSQAVCAEYGTTNEKVRAQLIPRKTAILSSGLAAKISQMPLHKGDSFTEGDTLVSFDCTVEEAQLKRAEAKVELDKKVAAIDKRLAHLQSISLLEVEKSAAKAKTSIADLAVMHAVIDKCTVLAPFSGKVMNLYARQYQFVSAGNQLIQIIDTDDLEIEIIVPSCWLTWLKTGMDFSLTIEETGKKYEAVITRFGASIDPVSQSLTIMGKIKTNPGNLLPGMSGVAYFPAANNL